MSVRSLVNANYLSIRVYAKSSSLLSSWRDYRKQSNFSKESCHCLVSAEKINQFFERNEIRFLRMESNNCRIVQNYKRDWSSYSVSFRGTSGCKIVEEMKEAIPLKLQAQPNILKIAQNSITLQEADLNAFALRAGEVTLAGEGGHLVGKKEYWASVLAQLEKRKEQPVLITSIGGGVGYDAIAIKTIFEREGFDVLNPLIIDPNLLCAYLSQELEVRYYAMKTEEFFAEFFIRSEYCTQIFHLGTVLNVITENAAVELLTVVASHMSSNDVISLVIVDEKQIMGGNFLKKEIVNSAGLVRFTELKTNRHYKTVIGDQFRFLRFMKSLGLEGRLIALRGGGVAFLAYKAMKNSSTVL